MVAMATAAILDFGIFLVMSKTQNFSTRFTQNLFYTIFRGSFTTDQSPFLDRYDIFEKKKFEKNYLMKFQNFRYFSLSQKFINTNNIHKKALVICKALAPEDLDQISSKYYHKQQSFRDKCE